MVAALAQVLRYLIATSILYQMRYLDCGLRSTLFHDANPDIQKQQME
jgi:hypothetical protein